MKAITEKRPSPIAGAWYSGDPRTLQKQVDTQISQAELPDMPGAIVAIIAPHAGHRYSGKTAGYAYQAVKGRQYELVVVVSPLHSFFTMPLLTTAHQFYETPLGTMEIDRDALNELNEELSKNSSLTVDLMAYDQEHSIEIQLPFIQRSLTGTPKLLPLMMRSQDKKTAQCLGQALGRVLKQRSVLLVASTDLSHFFDQNTAGRMDQVVLDQIQAFSPEGVLEVEKNGTGAACGHGAVAAVLWAARELGADTVRILHHSTSADQTGDRSSVVGYGAAAILKTA